MDDDPLAPDPLSPTSSSPPAKRPTGQTARTVSASSTTASWARHDLLAEPFSGAWAAPSVSPPASDSDGHSDTEPTPASSTRPTAPITMRSASSLSRERTSSTVGMKEGRSSAFASLHDGRPPRSSSPSPEEYGVSVTPRGGGASGVQGFTARNKREQLGMSETPRGSTSGWKHRTSPLTGAEAEREQEKEVLRQLVFAAVQEGDLDRLRALMMEPDEEEGGADDEYPSAFEISNWYNDEGETPLHRACFKGHLHIAIFLENSGANVEVGDKDGWTPLMNAAARGYLDIVRWLVEDAGAVIDRRSKHGYTALMNGASRGHLPVIQFLTTKHRADPLLRNEWGETAFDLAASVFEVQICNVLSAYESSLWNGSAPEGIPRPPYNPLSLHSTIPVVLHENQRLARPTLKKLSSLGGLASSQAPRWSSKALSRNDARTAFTMRQRPCFRNEVGLPVVGKEDDLILPGPREVRSGGKPGGDLNARGELKPSPRSSTTSSSSSVARRGSASSALNAVLVSSSALSSPELTPASSSNKSGGNAPHSLSTAEEPAWFWLSDWTVDLTDPHSSPLDGWSYASSFSTPDDEWSPQPPEVLEKLLSGGAGAGGLGGQKWVRRRGWVRVMRRRLDLPDWGFGGVRSEEAERKTTEPVELVRSGRGEEHDVEADTRSLPDADYLVRAQFLAGTNHALPLSSSSSSGPSSIRSGKTVVKGGQMDKVEVRKMAARLERSCDELRRGMTGDEVAERRRRAQDQLETYLHQLALIKAELGPEGNEDDDSDDEFIYSGRDADPDDDARSTWTAHVPVNQTPSIRSGHSSTSDYFAQPPAVASSSASRYAANLTPDLSRAPDFRVPTHETSQIYHEPILPPPRTSSFLSSGTVPVWEPDEAASECRRCAKKFSFFNRKHHCRRCGLVCCAACTPHFDRLDLLEVVKMPGGGLEEIMVGKYRTCDACHAAIVPSNGSSGAATLLTAGAFFPSAASGSQGSVAGSPSPSDAGDSVVSELGECPVCGTMLGTLGDRPEQEEHVKDCLETGAGTVASGGRFLTFNLPPGPLVSEECKICFVEFEIGDKLARMPCLCCFHHTCINAWLSRGKSCPFHATRD